MTQEIINNFLLKVGSSRYQDPEFIKNNPGFSSISRFGIGVLSTFMIADSVEIVSCHPDEDQARRLILRSVHGKYLIRLLDKGSGDPQAIGPHGTIFRLHIRPSVEIADVVQTAQHWIVVPDCKVTVQVDDNELQCIGYSSPADALRDLLKSSGLDYYEDASEEAGSFRRRIRIVEQHQDGVTIAYALTWNQWFKEWSFLTPGLFPDIKRSENEKSALLLGTCVEGIRIVTDTPGYEGFPIVALANIRGQSAPKTNVARSGLEVTPERDAMLRIIYSLYSKHIISELLELTAKRAFSLTWAAGETAFLIAPLFVNDRQKGLILSPKLLLESLQAVPCILVEETGKRIAKSPKELIATTELWTIDCALLLSAESLIREVASDASLSQLVNALNVSGFKFPDAPVVCGVTSRNELAQTVFESKEVDKIIVNSAQRRVDLRWVNKNTPPRWIELPDKYQQLAIDVLTDNNNRSYRRSERKGRIPKIPNDGVSVDVPSGEIAVIAFGSPYLVPESEIATFARRCIENVHKQSSRESACVAIAVLGVIGNYLTSGRTPADTDSVRKSMRVYDRLVDHFQLSARIEDLFNFDELTSVLMRTNWKSYDTSVWRRSYLDY